MRPRMKRLSRLRSLRSASGGGSRKCWLVSPNGVWDNSRTLSRTNFSTAIFGVLFALALLVCAAPAPQIAQERTSHPIAIIGIPNEIAPLEARLKGATVTRIREVVFNSGAIDGVSIVTV